MSKWAVTLNSGKALREAIDEEDIIRCFECLKACYQELHDKLPDTFTDADAYAVTSTVPFSVICFVPVGIIYSLIFIQFYISILYFLSNFPI